MRDSILQAQNLKICFKLGKKDMLRAVNGLSFAVHEGQRVAIVGESGCGKTTVALSIMNLLPSYPVVQIDGRMHYRNQDLLSMREKDLQKIRGNRIAMIFQDPMVSLNPFLKIATQLTEPLLLHKRMSKKEAKEQAIALLALVGMDNAARRIEHYPHEFSTGMRQRVMIAMALACSPEILIADEPVSALDATMQIQTLELIQNLSTERNMAVLMGTHDLNLAVRMADIIAVMYAGYVLEQGTSDEVFAHAAHPYTQALIRSKISFHQEKNRPLYSIKGQSPNLLNLGEGCPFWPRCPHRQECARGEHEFPPIKQLNDHHDVFCWLAEAENG